jgi:hypothetical protein
MRRTAFDRLLYFGEVVLRVLLVFAFVVILWNHWPA